MLLNIKNPPHLRSRFLFIKFPKYFKNYVDFRIYSIILQTLSFEIARISPNICKESSCESGLNKLKIFERSSLENLSK